MWKLKLKYLASVAPFFVAMVVMAAWMLSDLVEVVVKDGNHIYRAKHNFALIFLPLGGFIIVTGIFVGRLHRWFVLFGGVVVCGGIYLASLAFTMDLSNGHARVNANEVYSEWGTASEPESITMDFRKLSKLSLIKVPAEPFDHQWLIGTQSDGQLVKLEVNDLVKPALKRILANASAHQMEIRLDETAATYNMRSE